jgi:hypothetical protein
MVNPEWRISQMYSILKYCNINVLTNLAIFTPKKSRKTFNKILYFLKHFYKTMNQVEHNVHLINLP